MKYIKEYLKTILLKENTEEDLKSRLHIDGLDYYLSPKGTHIWEDPSRRLQYRWVENAGWLRTITDELVMGAPTGKTKNQLIKRHKIFRAEEALEAVKNKYARDVADDLKYLNVPMYADVKAGKKMTADKKVDAYKDYKKLRGDASPVRYRPTYR